MPFAHRNIFCGNRLYQNKYEMNEWVQEARTKGITNPGAMPAKKKSAFMVHSILWGRPG
jgi:hypothetical protein